MGYIHINESFAKQEAEHLPRFLEWLNKEGFIQSEVRKEGSVLSLKKSLYSIYNNCFKKAKLSSFTAALNQYYLWEYYSNKSLIQNSNFVRFFCLGLISDNEILIQKLAYAGKDIDIPRRNKGSLNLMLQCAMREDVKGLKKAMTAYKKYAVKKRWHELQLEFYKAFIVKDENKAKEVLTELETPKLKKQNIFYGEFIDDYLSVLNTAYLKLCWRKGMKIHIDSDTVPMEMMSIEPLEHYEIEYPYLEGWETDEYKEPKPIANEKIYEAVGPYPEKNPSLKSKFVSKETVGKVVKHFCSMHKKEEKDELISFIWDAYIDPKQFDLKYKEYVQKNASFPVTNKNGNHVLEARPFWSELTEYDDEGFFRYCNHFIIMNEMSISHEKVEEYLEIIKSNLNKGGFFKKFLS